jgi:DNA repair photolyase
VYIYQPKGRAGEYGDLAFNIYNGCSHGCKYCYVPAATFKTREEFHSRQAPRKIDDHILDKEMHQHQGEIVFLCFTCDPYQLLNSSLGLTREMIGRLQSNGLSVNILTKGGSRSTRDFDLLRKDPRSKYGATLTFWMASDSLEWEPGAAQPGERIEALKEAHSMGIRTWASLEPVIDTGQSLELIRQTKDFVDEYKIGKWNHDDRAKLIDWKDYGEKAVALCRSYGKSFYVKKDLAEFLGS